MNLVLTQVLNKGNYLLFEPLRLMVSLAIKLNETLILLNSLMVQKYIPSVNEMYFFFVKFLLSFIRNFKTKHS